MKKMEFYFQSNSVMNSLKYPKSKSLSHCLTELSPIYQNKQTVGGSFPWSIVPPYYIEDSWISTVSDYPVIGREHLMSLCNLTAFTLKSIESTWPYLLHLVTLFYQFSSSALFPTFETLLWQFSKHLFRTFFINSTLGIYYDNLNLFLEILKRRILIYQADAWNLLSVYTEF